MDVALKPRHLEQQKAWYDTLCARGFEDQLRQVGAAEMPDIIGTTRYLQNLGFKALATTSAAFAWSRGFADGGVPRDPDANPLGPG